MSEDASVGRDRIVDFGVQLAFGAGYASALYLVITGFAADPDGCGGRFQSACAAQMYWRIGPGFGMAFVVAPVLHKVLPDIPFDRGTGRAAGIAALLLGGACGLRRACSSRTC